MSVKLPTEHLLEVLSPKGGCAGSSESTLAKMSNCWKSHATTQMSSFPKGNCVHRFISSELHLSDFELHLSVFETETISSDKS